MFAFEKMAYFVKFLEKKKQKTPNIFIFLIVSYIRAIVLISENRIKDERSFEANKLFFVK